MEEQTVEMLNIWVPVIGTLGGTIAGGVLGIVGNRITEKTQSRHRMAEQEEHRRVEAYEHLLRRLQQFRHSLFREGSNNGSALLDFEITCTIAEMHGNDSVVAGIQDVMSACSAYQKGSRGADEAATAQLTHRAAVAQAKLVDIIRKERGLPALNSRAGEFE